MSDVTFTPEQIAEIRRRVEAHCREQGFAQWAKDAFLAAFPPPKVTLYRTFTVSWGGGEPDTYRVNNKQVEWFDREDGDWEYSRSVHDMASHLTAEANWDALAAFADVCARPTEEVDA